MTNPEEQPVEPEGQRWLRLIGLEERIGTYLPDKYRIDGQPVKTEDFMLLYPTDKPATARILFEALEGMSADDERREGLVEALRAGFAQYSDGASVTQSPEA